MRVGVTEVRNTRKATSGERCSHYVRTTAEATSSERLRNSVARVTRRGAAGAEQRAPTARVELRPEDGYLQLVITRGLALRRVLTHVDLDI